jgi:hypothetical protein
MQFDNDEVEKIVENHVRKVLSPFADGKEITISGDSYYSITEKEKDDE